MSSTRRLHAAPLRQPMRIHWMIVAQFNGTVRMQEKGEKRVVERIDSGGFPQDVHLFLRETIPLSTPLWWVIAHFTLSNRRPLGPRGKQGGPRSTDELTGGTGWLHMTSREPVSHRWTALIQRPWSLVILARALTQSCRVIRSSRGRKAI